jgi:hypothetical protein
VRAGDVIVKKGATITPDDVARLAQAGLTELVAVRFEPGDIDENAAADSAWPRRWPVRVHRDRGAIHGPGQPFRRAPPGC